MDWGIFEKAQNMLLEKEGKRLAEEVFSKGSTEDDVGLFSETGRAEDIDR